MFIQAIKFNKFDCAIPAGNYISKLTIKTLEQGLEQL